MQNQSKKLLKWYVWYIIAVLGIQLLLVILDNQFTFSRLAEFYQVFFSAGGFNEYLREFDSFLVWYLLPFSHLIFIIFFIGQLIKKLKILWWQHILNFIVGWGFYIFLASFMLSWAVSGIFR